MDTVTRHFIDLRELQKVGGRVTELSQNEAACISSGAATGITLTVAACMTGPNSTFIDSFPGPPGIGSDDFSRFDVTLWRHPMYPPDLCAAWSDS